MLVFELAPADVVKHPPVALNAREKGGGWLRVRQPRALCSGQMATLLSRMFFAKGAVFKGKPGAAVVSCRRGGAASAFDQINKYFTISNMHIVSSQYWNMVHGYTPEDVRRDAEGLQTMRTLGRNLKCIELGKENGIPFPGLEKWTPTNFIR